MDHKFKVGDMVVYTNEFGVCWGVKRIERLAPPYTEGGSPRYHYEGAVAYWFSVEEERFTLADAEDLAWHCEGWGRTHGKFQEKHGRVTTPEELASLLDGDPWEGEA